MMDREKEIWEGRRKGVCLSCEKVEKKMRKYENRKKGRKE